MSFSNRNVVVTAFVCEDKHFFWIGQKYGWYYYPLFFFSHAGCKSTVISHFSYVILLQTQLKRWKIIFENWEGEFQRKFFSLLLPLYDNIGEKFLFYIRIRIKLRIRIRICHFCHPFYVIAIICYSFHSIAIICYPFFINALQAGRAIGRYAKVKSNLTNQKKSNKLSQPK